MGVNFLTSNKVRASLLLAASGEVPSGATPSATGFVFWSPTVDMAGYDDVTFFAAPNATGAARAKLEVRTASATGDTFDALTGSRVSGAAAHQTLAVSIIRPAKRYLRGYVAATGGILGKIWYAQSRAKDLPVSNNATGATGAVSESHVSPATGSA